MTRSILLKIALGAVGLVIAGFVIVYGVTWWALAQSQHGRPPALAQGVSDLDTGWPVRLRQTFPPGVPEAVLIRRLRDEGFEVQPKARSARLNWGRFPCDYTFTAAWTAQEGHIETIDGRWTQACI